MRLPSDAAHYHIRWKARANRWVYGTRPLVLGIRDVAHRLAAGDPEAAPLVVGNLSKRRGGDLPCSRSHNSGRDVDLGLYTLDRAGNSVRAAYHRFGPDGRSLEANGRYVFDVARNWRLIRALLTSSHFEPTALVLNRHLERLVLDHAREIAEPADLIARADELIDRPRWANLHRNHLHMRIACPPGHDRCTDDL